MPPRHLFWRAKADFFHFKAASLEVPPFSTGHSVCSFWTKCLFGNKRIYMYVCTYNTYVYTEHNCVYSIMYCICVCIYIRRPLALAKGERAQKFAAVMLESCCCSGVLHRLLHGTTARLRTVWLGHYFRLLHGIWRCGILVSDPASQRGCWPQEMFYGFQR